MHPSYATEADINQRGQERTSCPLHSTRCSSISRQRFGVRRSPPLWIGRTGHVGATDKPPAFPTSLVLQSKAVLRPALQTAGSECRAALNPTNALSALRLLTPVVSDLGLVTWESVHVLIYSLERSEALGGFQSFVPVATGIPAAPDGNLTTYFDFGADVFATSWFYRVRVE